MTMFSRSTSNFDRLLEKATNHLLLEPDWESILAVCDYIRSGEVAPKYAACAVKKKLYAANPHVSLFALQVLESGMKNCGSQFHSEVANKAFMDDLRELVKLTGHEKVKEKILELIQVWAHAFRNDPLGRVVQDALNAMRAEGYKFPQLKESDAMFTADSAPQWADADACHACGTGFSLVLRKHHCRACGQIFCGKCSSKLSAIPKFAIEKEVRVCDGCYNKLNKPQSGTAGVAKASAVTDGSPAKAGQKSSAPPGKTEQELQEEEELQMALALSQSEEESRKEREKRYRTSSLPMSMDSSSNNNGYSSAAPASGRRSEPGSPKQIDSELSRYLDRNYWEQKPWANSNEGGTGNKRSTSPAPSAPRTNDLPTEETSTPTMQSAAVLMNGDDSNEIDNFLMALRSALEIFVNRMNSNKLRGRPIANDSAVQSLFLNITNMHSQLLQHMQDQDDQRLHLEGLQDKLSQIRDARAALDALREEHQEKLRIEAEENERIRQSQMAQKLEIMRKKKQEYLQYQRQIALQRIQEQEAAMKTLQQTKYWPQGQPPAGQMPYQPQQAYPQPGIAPQHPNMHVAGGMPAPQQQIPYQPPVGPAQGYQPPPANYPQHQPVYMPGMVQNLPPQSVAPPQGNMPQHHVPPQQLPQQQQPQQQMPVHPAQSQQQPQHYAPPPAQEVKQPEVNEAPLISFD